VKPLSGVRVLDVSGPIGAYGSKLLAALGADVTMVEPPGGSSLRRWPPFRDSYSLVFEYYAHGKRVITLDWSDEAGLASLADGADIVFVGPTPDQPVAGLTEGALSWAPADAVIVCLTPFGLSGPWSDLRSTPLVSYSMSGLMWKLGAPACPPPPPPGQQIYDQFALHACTAALVCLRERPLRGGQFVELSLHELLAGQDAQVSRYGRTAKFLPRREARNGAVPTGVWPCKDGFIELMAHNPSHWTGFLKVIANPEDLSDPALADRSVRLPKEKWLAERVTHYLAPFTVAELMDALQAERVPYAPWYLPEDFIGDSQPVSRGFWQEFEGGLAFRAPGLPFVCTPALGQTGWRPAAGPSGGMAGLKVLSFGQVIAGNTTAMTLAELGADVVKIESRTRADPNRVRMYEDEPKCFEPDGFETNSFFASLSRSVQSIALDMTDAGDVNRFLLLLVEADVLIENFAGGVMEKWGLPPERLLEVNPRLVYIAISGYGRTGPRARAAAYGANITAYIGLTRRWVSHGTHLDYQAVATAVPAVLAGLAERDRTGRGVFLDLAQSEAAAAMMAPLYLGALNDGEAPDMTDGREGSSLWAGVFACAGDQAWVAVEVRDERDRGAVAALVGDGPLRDALAAWCAGLTPHQAMFLLQKVGVPAGAVHSAEEMFLDPQHAARGAFIEIEHPDLGPLIETRPIYRMSKTNVRVRRPSPRVGQHTEAVFERWLQR
jgi:crotonobetainyl-CoA:carnitine CoA-transferase CaiB-like acyl-CoA transferase